MVKPYSEQRVGDGPKRIPIWLGEVPVVAVGLEAWPKVGDRFGVKGWLWRVVEITDRVIVEREPS